MPSFFSDGSTPRRTDARWTILQKILGAITGGGGGIGGYQELFEEAEETPTILPDNVAKPASWNSTLYGTTFWWDPGLAIWY